MYYCYDILNLIFFFGDVMRKLTVLFYSQLIWTAILIQTPANAQTVPSPTKSTYLDVIRFLTLEQVRQMRSGRESHAKTEHGTLRDFYASPENQPIWVGKHGLSPKARKLIVAFRTSRKDGLNPDDFLLPSLKNNEKNLEIMAGMELKLSRTLLKYVRYARGGRMLNARLNQFFGMTPRFDSPEDIMEMAANTGNITSFLASLHPDHQQYQSLRKILHKKRALYKRKPSPSLEKQIIQIQMNMERWRLLPDDMSSGTGVFVWTNIPEMKTRIIQNGKTLFLEKAIVGKPSKQTPVFMDRMEWIEFFPTWYIPNSIKRNDLLPRLRRGNTKTLEQFNLKVDCGRHGRNPKAIDWKKVDIRNCSVTQPPSRTNVLGDIKFKFPNKYSVYMHDTDDKHLFKRKRRFMSHGCVRVQHPGRMAQILLNHAYGDKALNVSRLLNGKRRMYREVFQRPVPVYMTYFTMIASKTGKLEKFPDQYGHDRRMAHLFTNKASLFPAPKVIPYRRPKRKAKKVKKNWREEAF